MRNRKILILVNLKEPVIKSIVPLLVLKRVNVRRSSKAMAAVFGEKFNKAVARMSSSPTGLSSSFARRVIFPRRDQSCLQKNALIAKPLESQRYHRLDHRLLTILG